MRWEERNIDADSTHCKVVALATGYMDFYNILSDPVLLAAIEDGRIRDANQAALNVFGYTLEEIRDCGLNDLGAGSDAGGLISPECENGVEEFTFEWLLKTKNGEQLWVDAKIHQVCAGDKPSVLLLLRDVTARKEAEERLRLVREALDDCGTSVLIADREGGAIYLNAAFGELFGYTSDRLGEIQLETLFADAGQGRMIFERVAQGGHWHTETRMVARDRREFPASLRVTPVLGEDYDVVAMLCILNDETKQKQMETQLFQSQNMKVIGQLAAGIAHEINTPTQYVGDNLRFLQESFTDILSVTEACSAMLDAEKNGEVGEEHWKVLTQCLEKADIPYLQEEVPLALRQSLEGITRVSEIVRAMRQFTHPGTGERKVIDINQALLNTLTVARNEWRYAAEIETHLRPDLPPAPCFPGEINQVFLNLIINAAHAIQDPNAAKGEAGTSPESKGIISISTDFDDEYVEIRVGDTGSGIPENIRDRIFEPFFTTKDVGKGTGQGLAICYAVVVEKHEGTLTFETEVGKGTVFIIRLPLHIRNSGDGTPRETN